MKNIYKWSYLILPWLILPLTSCYYDEIEPINVEGVVSFNQDIIPIFKSNCSTSGCHSFGAVPPDLSPDNAYDNLFLYDLINTFDPEESQLYLSITSNSNPMPPSGKLPDYEISTILEWIKQGALNN